MHRQDWAGIVACVALFGVAGAPGGSAAVAATRSSWDGVYTVAQAGRGEQLYAKHCSNCHGTDLAGIGHAPPLSGDLFKANWNERPVAELLETILTSMPLDQPGRLNVQESTDVVAFLLSAGSYPPGATELSAAADALKSIQILSRRP